MDHSTSLNAIQTQDVPAFLAALEAKYGKQWIQRHFAFMAIVCEEGASGLFRTMGNGNNANLLKIAHAVIRSQAKMIKDAMPHLEELDIARNVMNTIWKYISADLGREGVPEAIFKGVMETQAENDTPPSSDAPQQ
jgi:hypothetical protein